MTAETNCTIIGQRTELKPELAMVLGSGLGAFVETIEDAVTIPYDDLAEFPATGVSGHAGTLVIGRIKGIAVAVLSGRAHYYEHGNPAEMRPALETLKAIGVDQLILTNSAGSLNPECPPGSVMLISDHINFAGHNPLIGEPSDARFVGLTEAYDAGIRAALKDAADADGIELP
ncbi:MAG TPA: purine-nucleoside phosphorylase, partial [Afifellaceae bacterium]|nr:purine-nucleoside phosphorylase [Afifellaceae bacterium]